MNGMRWCAVVLTVACHAAPAAQQVGDTDFAFRPASPAFEAGAGPVVCIDEAHNNFHTAEGRYKPFAELLRGDGYVVRPSAAAFTPAVLAGCRLLVIANAIGADNEDDWGYPHDSAFSREELVHVYEWIQGGGSLLLFVDHAPMPGAAQGLMAMLGAAPIDAYADGGPGPVPDIFSRDNGLLRDHPVTRGRNDAEQIRQVGTFTGHAFQTATDFAPLLVFGPQATAAVALRFNLPEETAGEDPRFSIAGWLHGAARTFGKGRVVLLGEAAMCTAQKAGAAGRPMGMNHPEASENPQFCLNAVRWLTGVLPQDR